MHASNPAIKSNNPPPSVSARLTSDGLSKAAGSLGGVIICYKKKSSGVKVPAASALCTFAPAASSASLKPRVSVQANECAARAKTASFAFKSALGGVGLPALKKTITRVTRADGSVSRSAGHVSAPCNVFGCCRCNKKFWSMELLAHTKQCKLQGRRAVCHMPTIARPGGAT